MAFATKLKCLCLATFLLHPENFPSQAGASILSVVQTGGVNNSGKEQKPEVFKLTLRGLRKGSDRTPLNFRIYEGSSGTKVFISYGAFRSPEAAKAELRLWLEGVKRVISEEPKQDILGQTTGYRATAVYVERNSGQDFNAILWTNEADFWRIECSSMAAALEFERRISKGEPLSP
jgi:hypothetical protein